MALKNPAFFFKHGHFNIASSKLFDGILFIFRYIKIFFQNIISWKYFHSKEYYGIRIVLK
jgi:hypothetical protein